MREKVWQIAVCDEETVFLEKIRRLAIQYYTERNMQAEIQCYDNADAFLQSNLESYDLILLDMNMQEKDGIEVAKELRSQKIETPIIYISAYIEMAPYGYVVNAFRYLLKSDLEQTFCFAMDDVMKELKHHQETIKIRTEHMQIEVPLSDIVFVESYKRYLLIHTKKAEHKQYGKISDMEEMLCQKGFLRIHKSYLVNLDHVAKIKNRILFLDSGNELPCSKERYSEIVHQYVMWKGR